MLFANFSAPVHAFASLHIYLFPAFAVSTLNKIAAFITRLYLDYFKALLYFAHRLFLIYFAVIFLAFFVPIRAAAFGAGFRRGFFAPRPCPKTPLAVVNY